jgi:hypothetical protein
MSIPPQPSITSDVSRLLQDFVVAGVGAATSLATAAILIAIERSTGFSFYTFMFWFVIPVGAVLSGFVAASGYYLGARLFNHRPTKILLLNMVVISVATFFLIHYFSYYFLTIEGKPVRDFVSFVDFLRIELSHTSVQFGIRAHGIGEPVELGAWGYLYAALQVVGFAAGGLAVFGHLNSLPYCERCAKYLSAKGSQTRYSHIAGDTAETTKTLVECVATGRFQDAIAIHAREPENAKDASFRSQIHIKRCKGCNLHWMKFTLSRRDKSVWKVFSEVGFERFTEEPITTGAPVAS